MKRGRKMSGSLQINQTAVESDSQVIKGAIKGLCRKTLSASDEESTIFANAKAKETFQGTQNAIASFSEALNQEAVNIKQSMELDEKLGNLVKHQ